jgi:RNA polymerase sigma-70 factor, ECF subfamily
MVQNGTPALLMTNLLDRYLLYRIRIRQDPEAFAKMYDRYVASIYRFVYLKVPLKEDAEDLTSEVFLKCWRFIHERQNAPHVRDVRALLYQIARNAIVDWYRARAVRASQTDSVTLSPTQSSTDSERDISDRGKGKSVIEASADLHMVMEQIDRLKDDYRDVLTLRLIDDLPFDLIAQVLEKTTGHVRVLYHRAKKALDALDRLNS